MPRTQLMTTIKGNGFEVGIGRVDDLVADGAALERAIAALPTWRREKCERLEFEDDRRRSVASWLVLEAMLAERKINAAALEVEVNEFGKPTFKDGLGLHFSISHSKHRVMVAISERPIGCDIEKIRPLKTNVMAQALAPAELEFVRAAPTLAARLEAFYRLWTRKESYVKALGRGFTIEPASFLVLPGQAPRGMEFSDYSFSEGYRGAVCVGHSKVFLV